MHLIVLETINQGTREHRCLMATMQLEKIKIIEKRFLNHSDRCGYFFRGQWFID